MFFDENNKPAADSVDFSGVILQRISVEVISETHFRIVADLPEKTQEKIKSLYFVNFVMMDSTGCEVYLAPSFYININMTYKFEQKMLEFIKSL